MPTFDPFESEFCPSDIAIRTATPFTVVHEQVECESDAADEKNKHTGTDDKVPPSPCGLPAMSAHRLFDDEMCSSAISTDGGLEAALLPTAAHTESEHESDSDDDDVPPPPCGLQYMPTFDPFEQDRCCLPVFGLETAIPSALAHDEPEYPSKESEHQSEWDDEKDKRTEQAKLAGPWLAQALGAGTCAEDDERKEPHQKKLVEATGSALETPPRIPLAHYRAMSAAMSDCADYLADLKAQYGDRFQSLGFEAGNWVQTLVVGKFELGKLFASMLRDQSASKKGELYGELHFSRFLKFKEVFERASSEDQLTRRPELGKPSTWDNDSEKGWEHYCNDVESLIEAFESIQKGKKSRKKLNESYPCFRQAKSKLRKKIGKYARETQRQGGESGMEMTSALGDEMLKLWITSIMYCSHDTLSEEWLKNLAIDIEHFEEVEVATLKMLIEDQEDILQFDGDHREKACIRLSCAILALLQAGKIDKPDMMLLRAETHLMEVKRLRAERQTLKEENSNNAFSFDSVSKRLKALRESTANNMQ
jgi:hypothetical protein